MKNIFLPFLVSFIVIILTPVSILAQPMKPRALLKKIDISLENIHTITYELKRSDKFFNSNDTLNRKAVGSLYIDRNDKIGAYHILNMKYSENEFAHYQYDGVHIASFSYHKDSLDVAKKVSTVNAIETNYNRINGSHIQDFILKDFFKKPNIFKNYKSFLAHFFIKKKEVEEDVFQNVPVYVLTVYGKNKKNRADYINNSVFKFYVRKYDFLPVAHSFYGEFEGMEQYEYCEIKYLEINPVISQENFKIDPTISEIKPKSIYEALLKYHF
jgi:hypothetical protein